MAVTLEGSTRRFIGLSTDSKPVPGGHFDNTTLTAGDITPGSSFLEADTGRIFRWDGSKWQARPEPKVADTGLQTLDVNALILRELVRIRLGLIEADRCEEVSEEEVSAALSEQ